MAKYQQKVNKGALKFLFTHTTFGDQDIADIVGVARITVYRYRQQFLEGKFLGVVLDHSMARIASDFMREKAKRRVTHIGIEELPEIVDLATLIPERKPQLINLSVQIIRVQHTVCGNSYYEEYDNELSKCPHCGFKLTEATTKHISVQNLAVDTLTGNIVYPEPPKKC